MCPRMHKQAKTRDSPTCRGGRCTCHGDGHQALADTRAEAARHDEPTFGEGKRAGRLPELGSTTCPKVCQECETCLRTGIVASARKVASVSAGMGGLRDVPVSPRGPVAHRRAVYRPSAGRLLAGRRTPRRTTETRSEQRVISPPDRTTAHSSRCLLPRARRDGGLSDPGSAANPLTCGTSTHPVKGR